MANTPQFTMRLSPELRDALQKIADRERRKLGQVVQIACEKFVEADKKARARK